MRKMITCASPHDNLTPTCPKCGSTVGAAPITERGWASRTPPVYGVFAACSCGARLSHFLALGDPTPEDASGFMWKLMTWERKRTFGPPVIGSVLAGAVAAKMVPCEVATGRECDVRSFVAESGERSHHCDDPSQHEATILICLRAEPA
jgi:hypothetical protein